MKRKRTLLYNRLAALAVLFCGLLSISVEDHLEGMVICAVISLAMILAPKNLFV